MPRALVVLAGLAGAAVVARAVAPDIARYVKISRM